MEKKDEPAQKPVAYISGISPELKCIFDVQPTILKTAKLKVINSCKMVFVGNLPERLITKDLSWTNMFPETSPIPKVIN